MTKEEAAAGVINNIVDNLKGSPLIIGLLVMNAIFFAFTAYGMHDASVQRHDELMEIIRECTRTTHSDIQIPDNLASNHFKGDN